jgi:hypothetical protein
MQPYGRHLYYKLFRALENEGLEEKDMVFDENPTFVSDIGFFTLRFDQNIPQVVHFLVWDNRRTWHNSIHLYREMKNILIQLDVIHFIAMLPKGKTFWKKCFGLIEKTRAITPYATNEDGNAFYLITLRRALC